MSSLYDFLPQSPLKLLTLDEESGYLKIFSNDFTTKFMFQLVFNVNNVVHQYPYLQQNPYFAPLEVGEYLAIIDSNSVAQISDIRNDSLSPWNKRNHKSKQHSFIVCPNSGTCRRADIREDREKSNAKEYYAKHPDQKVTKRIFLAVTTGNIRPQPNTFVIIYYKVDEALTHQSLVKRSTISYNQEPEESFYEDDTSNSGIKDDPERQVMALLDGMLFTKGAYSNENNEVSNHAVVNQSSMLPPSINQSPSTSAAVTTVSQSSIRKRPTSNGTSTSPPLIKRSAKITILNPVVSNTATPIPVVPTASTMQNINFIRKRHFGLFEYTPYPCDPPSDLQNTPQSSYVDQAAKNYYKANNLTVETYHTSFPFQLQKGKDLAFKGKRKCAHCNADIMVDDNATVITHYEPFEYLISNSNHITTGHGNRIICIKFSCLKARYPFIDEHCFIVNDTVSQAEAKKVFDLVF